MPLSGVFPGFGNSNHFLLNMLVAFLDIRVFGSVAILAMAAAYGVDAVVQAMAVLPQDGVDVVADALAALPQDVRSGSALQAFIFLILPGRLQKTQSAHERDFELVCEADYKSSCSQG